MAISAKANIEPVLIAASVLFACCLGCAQQPRQHLFSGRGVTLVASQSAETISVQGWVVSDYSGRSLSLTFSNQSRAAIPMSAVVDEYTAKTADGRVIPLKDVDFLAYPGNMAPGEERTVTLRLPKGLAAQDVVQVIARLNQGKVAVVLQSIGPKEPPSWRVGQSTGIVVAEQADLLRMALPPVIEPLPFMPQQVLPPLAESAVAPVAPRSAAPVGTVPVNVSFDQVFGGTLRAEIFWNGQDKHVTLAKGDQQLFYLVPGQHEFHAVCRLPFMYETHARVPVVVSATTPIKIELSADAKLSGAELRVRLYQGGRVAVDQRFSPLS